MTRLERIRRAQRTLSARSHARWSAFQPDLREVERARANVDGTIPRPRYAASTPTQQARFDAREALRRTFDSPAYRSLRIAQADAAHADYSQDRRGLPRYGPRRRRPHGAGRARAPGPRPADCVAVGRGAA